MEKKRAFALTLVLFFTALFMLNLMSFYLFGIPLSPVSITGKSIAGSVALYVEGAEKIITIDSPLNQTYNFDKGDPYLLLLNVSADFLVDEWKYSLYDIRHHAYTESNTTFVPNISFVSVRWGNILTVSALETDGGWVNKNVIFYVEVPNSAPLLGAIDANIYACEQGELSYLFNASDVDEDYLSPSISPKNPLFVDDIGMSGYNISLFKMISYSLSKSMVGEYIETISVNDLFNSTCCTDNAVTNVTVIETNNAPMFLNGVGAETFVWMNGSDSTFEHQFLVSDVEDGVSDGGNLHFNLTWAGGENLFDVDSFGRVNYTPVFGHEGKSYSLVLCVTDNPLSSVHENFSICADQGYTSNSTSICDFFTLTVTDENRAPRIVSYFPLSDNITMEGTDTTIFNVTVSDDDMFGADPAVYPNIDWYVDGGLVEENEGVPSDEYRLTFGCGINGNHNVSVVVSDGLADTTHTWNVTVEIVACQVASAGGGGGGGGGASAGECLENWFCDDWDVCQNAKRSLDAKTLSPEDYYRIKDICAKNQYDERFCGFQLTTCSDINECGSILYKVPKPTENRVCFFTENPNCRDGITNCHDGGCEVLVDCGGPCSQCSTCSDGIQNQGEADIDCGGPCPYVCEKETPLGGMAYLLISLMIFFILIVIFILYKIIRIIGYKRKSKKSKND